ncbi:hypothetical protein T484DRAFT_1977811 [Baffinella frigidus]|nr:hypothetical protein T484DRAFT_1977811 [Cryptophyta sp. CCMP2293]
MTARSVMRSHPCQHTTPTTRESPTVRARRGPHDSTHPPSPRHTEPTHQHLPPISCHVTKSRTNTRWHTRVPRHHRRVTLPPGFRPPGADSFDVLTDTRMVERGAAPRGRGRRVSGNVPRSSRWRCW